MSTSDSSSFINLLADDIGEDGISSINIWWSEKEPDRIHLVIADTRLTEADGTKPGLRIVFSANPKSADYNPGNFNRCARLLREKGRPAPSADIDEHRRHLRYRDALIAQVGSGDNSGSASATKTPPASANICSTCSAFVDDVDMHMGAIH